MKFFVTGTDTDVGKTYVSAMLIRACRAGGWDCVGMKPLCCGERSDALLLHAAAEGVEPLNKVNPIWFRTPAAPLVASMIEERQIDFDLVRSCFLDLHDAHDWLFVEGVGGWLAPIAPGRFVSDLAKECGLPVLVVAGNQIGALNHVLLTVRAIQADGLKCAGIIVNQHRPHVSGDEIVTTTNASILESLLDVPILMEIEHGQERISQEQWERFTSRL